MALDLPDNSVIVPVVLPIGIPFNQLEFTFGRNYVEENAFYKVGTLFGAKEIVQQVCINSLHTLFDTPFGCVYIFQYSFSTTSTKIKAKANCNFEPQKLKAHVYSKII